MNQNKTRWEETHCQKLVENGKAICNVKLDCHLHDWRQRDEIRSLLQEIVEEIEGQKLQEKMGEKSVGIINYNVALSRAVEIIKKRI